jgi:predicted nuclease with TOPRIM domain
MKRFILTTLIWLFSASVVSATLAVKPEKLSQEALLQLEKIGFRREMILKKNAKQGDLEFILLRCRSDRRVYDISIFDQEKAYLSISYDDGKRFGKVSRFNQIDSLFSLIEKIEKREKARKPPPNSSNGASNSTTVGQEGKAADQRAGLEEALLREQKKDEKKTITTENRQLAKASANLASASLGTGGAVAGGEGSSGPIQGNQADHQSQNVAGKFANNTNPCGSDSSSQSTFGSPKGGLPNAANDIGGAAIMAGLAFLLKSPSGIGEQTGLGEDQSSKFLSGESNGENIEQYLHQKVEFLEGSLEQKNKFLRTLLNNTVSEKNNGLTQQYRTVQELYGRLKVWVSSEKIPYTQLNQQSKLLIDNLSMDRKRFMQLSEVYSTTQRLGFVIDVNDSSITLDPDSASPESASLAFFTGTMLLLKSQSLAIHSQLNAWQKTQQEAFETQDGPFQVSIAEKEKKIREFEKLDADLNHLLESLENVFEENPLVR